MSMVGIVGRFQGMMLSLLGFFNRFRRVDEGMIDDMLDFMSIPIHHPERRELATGLTKLVGRQYREEESIKVIKAISKIHYGRLERIEQVNNHKLVRQSDEIKTLRAELFDMKDLCRRAVSETMKAALSPAVFGIIDFSCLQILQYLQEDKELERGKLESKLRIRNGDLCWRLDLLRNLTLVEIERRRSGDLVRITELGKNLMESRGKEFEIIIEALRDESDVNNGLALMAVGGDKTQAGKLLHWLRGDKGRKHAPGVRDLYRVHGDARRLSKAFFGRREAGSRQEQHIGIKIEDHIAAGKLLIRVLTG
jgi:hypothetical protein